MLRRGAVCVSVCVCCTLQEVHTLRFFFACFSVLEPQNRGEFNSRGLTQGAPGPQVTTFVYLKCSCWESIGSFPLFKY